MNTLTTFIYHNREVESDKVKTLEGLESVTDSRYEVIENCTIEGSNFRNLTISGALLSLNLFKNVTFENCTFYGARIENCVFEQSRFINCSFEFTNVEHAIFQGTTFKDCNWQCSPLKESKWSFCELDAKTNFHANKDQTNGLWQCQVPTMEWSDILPASKDEAMTVIDLKVEDQEKSDLTVTTNWTMIVEKFAA